MKLTPRTRRVLFGLLALAVIVVVWLLARSPETSELATYKAELWAKGEKLNWSELGYPRSPDSSPALNHLLAGTGQLRGTIQPWGFDLSSYPEAGKARVLWREPVPTREIAGTNHLDWPRLSAEFAAAAPALETVRSALTNPPARSFSDPMDLLSGVWRPPLVELRKAAQWLSADTIVALQSNQSSRARENVVNLAQLSLALREDPSLVCQMVRTAIAGLGLAATWQALQAEGWTDADLTAMQQAWEAVDLLEAMELALTGERAFGARGFEMARNRDQDFQWPFSPNSRRAIGELLQEAIVEPYWRMHVDSDELLMLQHFQISLEAIRRIQGVAAWPEVQKELARAKADFDRELDHPIKRYRHLLSGVIVPNTSRASTTVIRNEVLRRLTTTALALERHQLRHGKYPAELAALVPEFLAAVPRDLFNAQPLNYRLNADGSYLLYSVGEDGRDDGGDPQPLTKAAPNCVGCFGLWFGRDAVWPAAAN